MAKPKTLEQLRAEKERTDYTLAQIDRVNVISLEDFSAHRERGLSKADGNTDGKSMTA